MNLLLAATTSSIPPESIPQIGLGTAALAIFAVCAGLVLLRGLTRVVFGCAVIAASVYVGILAWQHAPSIGIQYTGQPLRWLTIGWPILAGLLTFVILRLLLRFIIRPFGETDTPRSAVSKFFGFLFSFVPAGILCAVAALVIHHAGSLAELRSFAEGKTESTEGPIALWSTRLKDVIESNVPADWKQRLNLGADQSRLALAKLIAANANQEAPKQAAPLLKEQSVRVFLVNDPRIQVLLREKQYGSFLHHPSLDKALADPRVRQALDKLDL